jgi:hypothetical protein
VNFDLCLGRGECFWEFASQEDRDRVWDDMNASYGWSPEWAVKEGTFRIAVNLKGLPQYYRWKCAFRA